MDLTHPNQDLARGIIIILEMNIVLFLFYSRRRLCFVSQFYLQKKETLIAMDSVIFLLLQDLMPNMQR